MPTLQWVTRDTDVKRAEAVPYRLLEPVAALSAGDPGAGNMIVQGDNLDALKALLPYYAGQVKCIYIDPPYNTRSAVSEHYNDNLEHSQWLAMIYPRLIMLRELLTFDGSIWISLDDSEVSYARVICDEVFGRGNFVTSIIWEKRKSRENRRAFSFKHDYVLVFARNKLAFESIRNPVPMTDGVLARYSNPDNDKRGSWQSVAITAQAGHGVASQFYVIEMPSGRRLSPPSGNCWRFTQERLKALIADNRIWFGESGNNVPRQKRFLQESENSGLTPETIWYADDVGTNDTAKRHSNTIFVGDGFETPKPEELLARVLLIATKPNELVLDSFSGSGTTAAVAHKMGRRYIGIEMGEHAVTHCVPRLRKVIEGEQGISAAVRWQGGGGFTFYRLGEPVFDETGAIRPGIGFAALAAHVWFSETGTPIAAPPTGPFLGEAGERGLALLYNGILGDKRVTGGNVLTAALLRRVRDDAGHAGPLTIYGEASRLGAERLRAERVTFKQTLYDVRTR